MNYYAIGYLRIFWTVFMQINFYSIVIKEMQKIFFLSSIGMSQKSENSIDIFVECLEYLKVHIIE